MQRDRRRVPWADLWYGISSATFDMGGASNGFTRLSILIPAYNEAATLGRCLGHVLAAELPCGLSREVIVVDDGSTDQTWAVAREWAETHPEVRAFQQPCNQGKGAALRRAIQEMKGDLVLFQDADLEYDPADYARLLRPILDGRADVVYGSRFAGEERRILYFWHTAGNRLLTLLSNMLNDTNLSDMETCYKAFVAERLRAIPLRSNRFGIEPEITAKVARNRLRLYEVPIQYNGRTYEEGKKIGWRDGWAALWFILKFRFSSDYADVGKIALDALEQAPRFNQWMYDSIKPYLGRQIVELGAGRGNLSKFLKNHGSFLATDYRPDYLQELSARWGDQDGFSVAFLDLCDSSAYEMLRGFGPDTVVCINVLEHLADDRAVLGRLHTVLPEGARLVFLVPFDPRLTSEFDRQVGHFRRYAAGELEMKMKEAGFIVECQFYFNKVGVVAWWIGNRFCGQRTLRPWQLRLYNLLTPVFRILDRFLPTRGLSTVVVARRPGSLALRATA